MLAYGYFFFFPLQPFSLTLNDNKMHNSVTFHFHIYIYEFKGLELSNLKRFIILLTEVHSSVQRCAPSLVIVLFIGVDV